MKKFLTIMTAAVVLLCGLVLTGCSNDNNPFLAPKQTWFRRQITYTNSSGNSTNLYAYFCYSDDAFTPRDSSENLGAGLTVVVTSINNSDDPIITTLTSHKYLLKTFSNTGNTTVGGTTDDGSDNETKSFRMSYTKWCWMYNLIRMDQQEGTATPLKNDAGFTELTDLSSFSWKKIMAEYLLDNLLN